MISLKKQNGFTILELMIATAIFSVILLIATYGLLQVGRMFYKGITVSRTQETARALMEEISQNIQFSGEQIVLPANNPPGNLDKFCIGSRRYSFIRGHMMSNNPTAGQYKNAIVVDQGVANCTTASPQDISVVSPTLTSSSKELLQPGMRLSEMTITDRTNGLYEIRIKVITGDDGLLDNPNASNANCKLVRLGSQFCAVSELTTTVLKRVNVD